MTRIAIVTTELQPAGAERVVCSIATGLDRGRFQPVVCSLLPPGKGLVETLASAGVPVVHAGFTRDFLPVGPFRRMARLLKAIKPEIVNSHLWHANVLIRAVAAKCGIRAVVDTSHIVERRFVPWRSLLDRVTWKAADVHVCVSNAVARHMARSVRVACETLTVIPNGIDLTPFASLPDREEARRRFGVELQRVLLVSVGRLHRQKGHEYLVRAMSSTAERMPEAVLFIAGEGPEHGRIKRLIASLGLQQNVTLLGHVEDVVSLLAAADIFVAPSMYEGMSLAVMEAMAAGLPVIASDLDSMRGLIEDGRTGLLVPPGNAGSLADAILKVVDSLPERERLGSAAREKALREFSHETMVRRYEELFAGLL